MPPWLLPVAGLAANAFSSVLGYKGAQKTNKINQVEAAKNRQFQREMRNTSWQAGVADMEAAGINPALAYSQGGAAVPGGSMAHPAQNPMHSAMQMRQMEKSIDLLDRQIDKADTEEEILYQKFRTDKWKSDYLLGIQGDRQPILELTEGEIEAVLAGGSSARALARRNIAGAKVTEPMAQIAEDLIIPFINTFMEGLGRVNRGARKIPIIGRKR